MLNGCVRDEAESKGDQGRGPRKASEREDKGQGRGLKSHNSRLSITMKPRAYTSE